MLTRRRVVMVPGLMRAQGADVPLWLEYWIPPDSTDDFIVPSLSPSDIIGRESSEGALEIEARKLLKQLESETVSRHRQFPLSVIDFRGWTVLTAGAIRAMTDSPTSCGLKTLVVRLLSWYLCRRPCELRLRNSPTNAMARLLLLPHVKRNTVGFWIQHMPS